MTKLRLILRAKALVAQQRQWIASHKGEAGYRARYGSKWHSIMLRDQVRLQTLRCRVSAAFWRINDNIGGDW